MLDAYIYEGLSTPFGRHAGTLAKVRPDDLLADVMRNLMQRSAFKPEQVEDLVVGCANQAGEDSRCVARHAGLVAGLPIETPGRCSSEIARAAWTRGSCCPRDHCRGGRRVPGGRGREHEPRADSHEQAVKRRSGGTRGSSTARSGLASPIPDSPNGSATIRCRKRQTISRKYRIRREEADRFAARSQQRYAVAKGEGFSRVRFRLSRCRLRAKDRCRPWPTTSILAPTASFDALAKMKALYRGQRHQLRAMPRA